MPAPVYPVLLAAVLGVTGCALTDATIRVEHPRAITTAALSSGRTVSLFVRMPDVTLVENRQGVKKNGYATVTANVYTDPKPAQLVERALKVELERAGFTCQPGVQVPRIAVDLHQVFAEPEVGVWAGDVYSVVDATITVLVSETKAYKRRFKGIGKITTMLWTDEYYKQSYEMSLRDFLVKAVPEIVNLF